MGQLTKQFGKIKVEVEIPHLLNLQVDSYRKFMQEGRTERLPDEGLALDVVAPEAAGVLGRHAVDPAGTEVADHALERLPVLVGARRPVVDVVPGHHGVRQHCRKQPR